MTGEKKFNIVFENKLKDAAEISVVKEKLKKFYNNNLESVEKLFLKDSSTIKRNLTLSDAEKYQTVIESTGAICSLKK